MARGCAGQAAIGRADASRNDKCAFAHDVEHNHIGPCGHPLAVIARPPVILASVRKIVRQDAPRCSKSAGGDSQMSLTKLSIGRRCFLTFGTARPTPIKLPKCGPIRATRNARADPPIVRALECAGRHFRLLLGFRCRNLPESPLGQKPPCAAPPCSARFLSSLGRSTRRRRSSR